MPQKECPMIPRSFVLAIVFALALPLTVASVGLAPRASAQGETAFIEVHKALCPAGYEPNSNIFDDCHGNGGEGYIFALDGPDGHHEATTVIENTPGPGIAPFTSIATAGTYMLTELGATDTPLTPFWVYCSLATSESSVPFTVVDGGISLDLALGDAVICDWYNLPVSEGPEHKADCKHGLWQTFPSPHRFKNQGDCVRFVQTGK
jgi:hypothetical protein